MLAGKRPFIDDALQKLHKPPVPLCEHAPTVPQALSDIVMKAMAVEAESRYQTVAELAAALRTIA